MKHEQRKAAVTAYRERKTAAGIYAVVCLGSGQRWLGRAADLDSIQKPAVVHPAAWQLPAPDAAGGVDRAWGDLRNGNHRAARRGDAELCPGPRVEGQIGALVLGLRRGGDLGA